MSEMGFIGHRRRGPGRPPRAGVRADCPVQFVVTRDERAALDKMAIENRRPLASIIREAVNTLVADYGERVVFPGSGDRFSR